MVEAWHVQSVYLGQNPQNPQQKAGQQQNQQLTPVPANQLPPPSSSESGSAEPIPPPSSQPVQLSQVPKAGTPPPNRRSQPAQSAYVGAQTGNQYQQSNYVGRPGQSPSAAKASPKPPTSAASQPGGTQQYFGKDATGPTEYPAGGGQGPPPGAGDKFVQSVYLGQGPNNGQNARPGGPGSKGPTSQVGAPKSQLNAHQSQAGVAGVGPAPDTNAKLTPAPVGNQAELDRQAKEREKALEEQKRQLQEREDAEKAEAKRLEAEKKRLEEEKERLAKEKVELEKEKERLAKLKAQKEKEAKEKDAKEKDLKDKDGKEKDAKDKDGKHKDAKEEFKDAKESTADTKAGAKGAGAKQKHKYSGGPSLNADRKEKLNVEVEPGKVVYAHPYDRQQIVDITLKNISGEIVHFKVMSTQPKFYRVKNKQNVILPGQSAVAGVRLEVLKNPAKCKKENHRIIIQTAISKKAQEDKKFWRDIDGKKNRVQFSRIPVRILLEGEKDNMDGEELEYDNSQPFIVEPESDLIFRGPYDDAVTSPICAINNTDKFMFVKVLITNPDPFRVRPNFCVIAPRSMQIFAAILEPQSAKDLEKIQKKKNKFMLEYVENDKGDQDAEHFFQKHPKNIQSIKLNAIFQND